MSEFREKTVLVLGLGASGLAAARLLLERGADVVVLDSGEGEGLRMKARELESEGAVIYLGSEAEGFRGRADLAVISPGIGAKAELFRVVRRLGIPLIGEVELAFRECRCPVVGITGSNGKTTTTGLLATMLGGCSLKTTACGNVGLPFCEVVRGGADWDVLVVEVSSFQLETIETFRPRVAVWLNLTPNHLDRYDSMDDYRRAKERIFENQTEEDFAVVNGAEVLPTIRARRVTFSAFVGGTDFGLEGGWIVRGGERVVEVAKLPLAGLHNVENLMAALAAGECLGLDVRALVSAAEAFRPLPHRCEFLGLRAGVRWVNDSKSTSLDATVAALRAVDGRVVLIAGGKDKGFEFGSLLPLVRERVRFAVLIGEMRQRIADAWPGVECYLADSVEEAVRVADEVAQAGETVLFSPGTSSFDMFESYIQRGERFREAFASLAKAEKKPSGAI